MEFCIQLFERLVKLLSAREGLIGILNHRYYPVSNGLIVICQCLQLFQPCRLSVEKSSYGYGDQRGNDGADQRDSCQNYWIVIDRYHMFLLFLCKCVLDECQVFLNHSQE